MNSLGGGTSTPAPDDLEAWRPILEARVALNDERRKLSRPRVRTEADRKRDYDRAELAALAKLPRGLNLPPHLMRSERRNVTTWDLLQNLPCDGSLFEEHKDELWARARADGITPTAVFVRTLLAFLSEHVRAHVSLQGPKDELAELAGCHRSTIYRALADLEERGEVRSHKRTRRYALAVAELGAAAPKFDTPDGETFPITRWVDREGNVHRFYDQHGVIYATRKGVLGARRKESSRGQALAHGLWSALWRTLGRLLRQLHVRLLPAPAPETNATPYPGRSVPIHNKWGGSRLNLATTGPPNTG